MKKSIWFGLDNSFDISATNLTSSSFTYKSTKLGILGKRLISKNHSQIQQHQIDPSFKGRRRQFKKEIRDLK